MPPIVCRDKVISLDEPVIMGIINLTPDSFYDGGQYREEHQYVERAGRLLEEGASILDIGAVSTRPGAAEVDEEEESGRLIPAIRSLVRHFPGIVLSVDTYRAGVARQAAGEGACMINDISGGNLDDSMFSTMAALKLPYILMHMQGTPATMQTDPKYDDPVREIADFFREKLKRLEDSGVGQVILDPGFGFGKTVHHNYTLLKHLDAFNEFGRPLLVGLSRKSMITRLLDIKPSEALHATGVLHTLALLKGAHILRVHDVKEAKEVIRLVRMYESS